MRNRLLFILVLIALMPDGADAARLWTSGCEMQSDSAPVNITTNLEFEAVGGRAGEQQIVTDIKRSGVSACKQSSVSSAGGSNRLSANFHTSTYTGTTTARTYFYIETMPTTSRPVIMQFWDIGIDAHEGGIRLNWNGTLTYLNDELTPLATTTTALTTGVWYRLELAYNDLNSWEFRIDGNMEIRGGAHSGDAVDIFSIACIDETAGDICKASFYFDDIAINDATGSAQTGFPGTGSVVHMQPDSAGDSNGCSSGSFSSLDEITPNDATDFCNLDADSGGDIVDVNVESSSDAGISSGDTITLVQVGIRAAGASAASYAYNVRLKSASGGTTSSGSTLTRAVSTYQTNGSTGGTSGTTRIYTLASYTDPTTSVAWTPTGTNSLDNMQIGANASDGNPDVRVTTLWAIVEYVPSVGGGGSAPTPQSDYWFD